MGRLEGFLVRRPVPDDALLRALVDGLGTSGVALFEDDAAPSACVLVERRLRASGFVLDVSLYRVPDAAPHALTLARRVAERLGEEILVSPPPRLASEAYWVWIVPGQPAMLASEDPRDDAADILPATARPLPGHWRGLAG